MLDSETNNTNVLFKVMLWGFGVGYIYSPWIGSCSTRLDIGELLYLQAVFKP